jgi:hypothetical protein
MCFTGYQIRNCALLLNRVVKNRKDTEKCYAQCGRFSGQRKNVKESPFQERESLLAAWFKQARGSSALISGILWRKKVLHIATGWPQKIFKLLMTE